MFEASPEVKELGVGINLLPHAVQELTELDWPTPSPQGLATGELALYNKHGQRIWAEPRLAAGYRWPQYSIHRGRLLGLLHAAFLDRLGAERYHLAHRVRVDDAGPGVVVRLRDGTSTDGAIAVGRRHPLRRPRPALPGRGSGAVERPDPLARDGLGAALPHRPLDGRGRTLREARRRLSAQRAARGRARTDQRRVRSTDRGGTADATPGLGPHRRSRRCPHPVRDLPVRLARPRRAHRRGAGVVAVPHGRPRPAAPVVLRPGDVDG